MNMIVRLIQLQTHVVVEMPPPLSNVSKANFQSPLFESKTYMIWCCICLKRLNDFQMSMYFWIENQIMKQYIIYVLFDVALKSHPDGWSSCMYSSYMSFQLNIKSINFTFTSLILVYGYRRAAITLLEVSLSLSIVSQGFKHF